jgi:hypothetical protein
MKTIRRIWQSEPELCTAVIGLVVALAAAAGLIALVIWVMS